MHSTFAEHTKRIEYKPYHLTNKKFSMKSIDKASELFYKVYNCPALSDDITFAQAQIIAIMMADEVQRSFAEMSGYDPDRFSSEYWEEVKRHIEKL